MSPTFIHFPARQTAGLACLLLASLVSGCVSLNDLFANTHAAPSTKHSAQVQAVTPHAPDNGPIPVIRQGRYTLVELIPRAGQRELQLQIISMHLPRTVQATVGDALQHVLLHSGYALCAPTPETQPLYALPLPAAHFDLGPMTLHDALTTLAGPAWTLSVDEALRQVCFTPPLSLQSGQAVSTETRP